MAPRPPGRNHGERGVPRDLTSARGAEDPRAPAGPRCAGPLLGRLRRDRLVDLRRPRDHRAARARPHPRGARARRSALPGRRPLLCRGHDRDPGDGRRRHLRPPCLQRPRRLPDRLGAVPRLPDRDRALRALHAALPRRRAQVGVARAQPLGRGGRRRRDHGRRARPARAAVGLLPVRDRRRGAGPVDPGDARRARLRVSLLGRRAHARRFDRHASDLAPDRLRAPARDARLHRPRDGREPGRGDAGAGPRPPAQPLLRDRTGRPHLRRDCARRPVGVPGSRRHDGARNRLAARAADGDRRRARGPPAGRARDRAPHVRRPHRGGHPPRRGNDVDLGLHAARPLARRARPAPSRVRAPEPPHPRLAPGDRRRRPHLVGTHDRDVLHQGRHRVPRQPLQLRRPGRVHGGPARRDQASLQRAASSRVPTGPPPTSACAESRSRCRRSWAP